MTKSILAVLAAVALLAPNLAGAQPAQRHAPWHHHAVPIPAEGRAAWKSQAVFSPRVGMQLGLYVDGVEIAARQEGCRTLAITGKVAAIVAACQPGFSHMWLRATSFDGKPHRVTVVYRTVPL